VSHLPTANTTLKSRRSHDMPSFHKRQYSTLVACNYCFPSQRLPECNLSRSVLAVRLISGTRQRRALLSNRLPTNPTPSDAAWHQLCAQCRKNATTVRSAQACHIQNRLRPKSQIQLGTSDGNMSTCHTAASFICKLFNLQKLKAVKCAFCLIFQGLLRTLCNKNGTVKIHVT